VAEGGEGGGDGRRGRDAVVLIYAYYR